MSTQRLGWQDIVAAFVRQVMMGPDVLRSRQSADSAVVGMQNSMQLTDSINRRYALAL
jgi:hypothetical protein